METAYIKTPVGIAAIRGDANGISSIAVQDEELAVSNEIPLVLLEAVSQLNDYFEGKRLKFDFRLNPVGTDFQKKVWQELQKIPYSKTMTYMEQTKKLGDVKAIRAVASANGRNPLWIVVPCHRVIGTNGFVDGLRRRLVAKKVAARTRKSKYTTPFILKVVLKMCLKFAFRPFKNMVYP